ncbi:MAG: dynamin family protein, partial [Burkholderiaceae bacterium]|nr:dynamin family protein [Burkholderiaceae bacterium]
LGYDPDVPPCLRLLPIETRLQPQALAEWRHVPEQWTHVDLDVNNAGQLAQALEKVAEVRRVPKEQARALGFWHESMPEDNPPVDAEGMVEVPRWRHALVNIAHPLLRQGLVILDTPGLNAIGAEPELTVSLIPQAHAVVFILAADAGVTKSDLTIWREHLITEGAGNASRLVVLNKIDMLWDALSSPQQVHDQIERQRQLSADILGLPVEQVIPVSAQKGLVATITKDDALLQASQLPQLEQALSQGVMGQRQKILRAAVAGGTADLRAETLRAINIRRRDLAEQMLELKGLRGKNVSVIKHMRSRVQQEQSEFDASGAKIHAMRSVHLKLLGDVFDLLGNARLKTEMGQLTEALRQRGIKLGVRRAYAETFERLRAGLARAQGVSAEIQTMLGATFRQLNSEFGFSLQAPKEPDMERYGRDLTLVERSHLQYLSVSNTLKLVQPEFAERLVRALSTRLRVVYESALGEIELWNKSAAAQLDAQLRERRRNFGRRMEAIERIQNAASALDDRISEIEISDALLNQLDLRLEELTAYLINTPETGDTTRKPVLASA